MRKPAFLAPVVLLFSLALVFVAHVGPISAGDDGRVRQVGSLEAMEMLEAQPRNTFLVDVRPRAEYVLQGHAPMAYNVPWRFLTTDFQVKGGAYRGGRAQFTGYQLSSEPNPDFVGVMQSLFKLDDRIIILSAWGDQGSDACLALVEAGFRDVSNVKDGFWGPLLVPEENEKLAERHSPFYGQPGKLGGWVFWGLPVTKNIEPRLIYPPDIKRMQNLE